MVFSLLASRTHQLLDRAPIMFQWLTKNEPTGTPSTTATTATTSSPAMAPFWQELGKIAVVSFLGGSALGLLKVIYFRKSPLVSSFRNTAWKLCDRTSSSFFSTARIVGQTIINVFIFATIVTFRLVPALIIRSAFASKHFFRLTFGG